MTSANPEPAPTETSGYTRRPMVRIPRTGAPVPAERAIAEERPVALEYQGIGYAVLMATPADLVDLAYGFSLSERLVDRANQILDVDVFEAEQGHILRIQLAPEVAGRIADRVRHRATDASCGLCGIENLEQAMRALPRVSQVCRAEDAACFAALEALPAWQPLNRATGSAHAAAACSAEGVPLLVREDVGRHNAFDKLIGAMVRADLGWNGGFALLTSRCSYELVEKAVLANCPMLATISAPTGLAIERAAQAGLRLRVLVRGDALLAANPGD